MFKNKKLSIFIISALALTLAFGLIAFIQVDRASAATSIEDGFGHRGGPGDNFKPGERGTDNEYLAEALGISVEELEAAYQSAQTAGLELALEEGLITEEQAEAMAERGFFGRRGFGGSDSNIDFNVLLADALGISVEELDAAKQVAHEAALADAVAAGDITEEEAALIQARKALHNYLQKDELLAKALGISVEELEAAKENGQRIPDLLEELGIAQEEFEANMQAAQEEALQQAVEDGAITQEQADQILEEGFKSPDSHGGRGGGHDGGKEGGSGRPPGHGGRDGTNGTNPQNPVDPASEG